MGKRLTGRVIALLAAAGAAVTISAAEQPAAAETMKITRDGAPAANVMVEFRFVNGGKFAAGTTGTTGDLAVAMSAINGGKPIRLQAVIYDCTTDQSMVVFIEAGAAAPDDRNCRKVIVGWVWFGRGRLLTIDIARATLQSTGQSFLRTRNGQLAAGAGAAALGAIALTAGGGDSGDSPSGQSGTGGTTFSASGTYPVTNTVASNPANHPIGMETSTVLVIAVTGTSITITCPPGSKWTAINGTITNGQITGEGRGTAAGFSNVLFRFTGTIAMSGSNQGTLAGQLTVGAGGEFPGGQPTVYTVSGRKQ